MSKSPGVYSNLGDKAKGIIKFLSILIFRRVYYL